MRRALLLAALAAAPSLAAAQTTPGDGVVTNGTTQGSNEAIRDDGFINIDECTNTGGAYELELVWNTKPKPNETGTGTKFIVFGSRQEPPAAEPRFCPAPTTDVTRWQIGADVLATTAGDDSRSESFPTQLFVTSTGSPLTCDADQADTKIWLCVHFQTNTSTDIGWAVGAVTLSLRRPPPPRAGSVVAAGGEGALDISWGAAPDATGVQAPATSYRVIVKQGTTEIVRRDVTPLSVRVEGLTNGTTYRVEVYSLSAAMNESPTAETADGTPKPVLDFWEYYRQDPAGREQGGCGAGAAGPLALLAVAALLGALRRRA